MLELTDILLLSTSILIIFIIKLLDKNPKPILGCYQKRNGMYWIKVAFMYIILSLRKLKKISKDELEERNKSLDKPQILSNHEKAIDAVYMNGADIHGNHLVVGTARRKNLLVDGFVILKIEDMLLETPKMPDTALHKNCESDEYFVEGIKLTPMEPMKSWHLNYDGKMKERSTGEEYDVKINGIWTSNIPYFNFDTDMDPLSMAKSMAYEKWNANYFHLLKAAHQTHYEQFGKLKTTITINKKVYKLELDTVRDHSFGYKREWRQFHRYGIHFFTTSIGDHFHIGKVCCPITFSRLTIGYVYSSANNQIFPVEECDLELYQHGEPPKDYAFMFKAGGRMYTVEVEVKETPIFYLSEDWEAKFYENLCKFKVNNETGWGAAEWQYRNINGRNLK